VFYPGTVNAAAAETVRVTSGEERGSINLPLQIVAMARLSGTIIDAAAQPVTIATLTLVPRRRERASPVDALAASGALPLARASVSSQGFVFGGVAPGEYTLVARSGYGMRGAAADPAAAAPLWSVTDLIVDGSDRSDLVVQLLPGVAISGSVRFEKGLAPPPQDAAGVEVVLLSPNPLPGLLSSPRATVAPNGSFRFSSVPPGQYLLRATASQATGGARWALKSAVVDGRELADQPLLVASGTPDLSAVAITFSDRLAGISGRIIDTSNQPVTRYSIVVFTQDRRLWLPGARRIVAVRPATDGLFAIGGLPSGDYALAAVEHLDDGDLGDPEFLAQLLAASVKLTLGEGELKRQDLRVGR
jgi:hypothetical protein